MRAFAALAVLAILGFAGASAAEPPVTAAPQLAAQAKDDDGLPKGTYKDSCQCQLSGGLLLMCMCSNLQARYFQTTLDVRNCPAPKDIKNCNGSLKCVDPRGEC